MSSARRTNFRRLLLSFKISLKMFRFFTFFVNYSFKMKIVLLILFIKKKVLKFWLAGPIFYLKMLLPKLRMQVYTWNEIKTLAIDRSDWNEFAEVLPGNNRTIYSYIPWDVMCRAQRTNFLRKFFLFLEIFLQLLSFFNSFLYKIIVSL